MDWIFDTWKVQIDWGPKTWQWSPGWQGTNARHNEVLASRWGLHVRYDEVLVTQWLVAQRWQDARHMNSWKQGASRHGEILEAWKAT